MRLSSHTQTVNHISDLLAAGDLAAAKRQAQQLTDQAPTFAPGWARLSEVCLAMGEATTALEHARRAVQTDPRCAFSRLCLGIALRAHDQHSEAVLTLGQALTLNPNHAPTLSHYGLSLVALGRQTLGVEALNRARQLEPDSLLHSANWLINQQYVTQLTSAQLRTAAQEFGRCANDQARGAIADSTGAIGFFSRDLYHHPVGLFLLAVMEHRPADSPRWLLFADNEPRDAISIRLAASADEWIATGTLSNNELAAKIRGDRLGALIELSGHTCPHRLGLMTQPLAPRQFSWLGMPASTGIAHLDGVLLGTAHQTPSSHAFFVEPVVDLPGCHFMYPRFPDHPPAAPRVSENVRFGCFNNSAKINGPVLDCWSDILRQVSGATLLLKWRSYADAELCRHIRSQFVARGVAGERILFQSHEPHDVMMDRYNDVDVALDPFPFAGGISTCEALFMGTPVVTMGWQRPASRQGVAILNELGYSEWVASTPAEYARIAIGLGQDSASLSQCQTTLRDALDSYRKQHAPTLAGAINQLAVSERP